MLFTKFSHLNSKNDIIIFISWFCLYHHVKICSCYNPTKKSMTQKKIYDPTKNTWRTCTKKIIMGVTITSRLWRRNDQNRCIEFYWLSSYCNINKKKTSKCCQDKCSELSQTSLNYGMVTCVLLAIARVIQYIVATSVGTQTCFSHTKYTKSRWENTY